MAFNQYTQCVDIANFSPRPGPQQAILVGLYATLPAAVVAALIAASGGAGPCLLYLLWIFAVAATIGYCYWWLYRRLVCVPGTAEHPADSAGDHLAIGMLINIEPPGSGSFFDNIDNDYSIGILPLHGILGDTDEHIEATEPFGYLITQQPVTRDHGLRYAGEHAVCPGHPESERSAVLHCEFEGRGVYDFYLAAQVALLPAVAALFICFIPGVGWLIALLLFLFSLAVWGTGLVFHFFDAPDPTRDVNPNAGELHQCKDTLVLKGHWVYDSEHSGAYELHPVTYATICDPTDAGDVTLFRNRWQGAIDDATSPATLASQKQPQNQWQVHPIIDGCQPPIIV